MKYLEGNFKAINHDLDLVPIFFDEQLYFASMDDFDVGPYGDEIKTW